MRIGLQIGGIIEPTDQVGRYAPMPEDTENTIIEFGVKATNREVFVNKINEIIKKMPSQGLHAQKPVFEVTLSCGENKIYQEIKDIPSESVPCSCGNPTHFFIKYGDEK